MSKILTSYPFVYDNRFISNRELLKLLEGMLRSRRIEEKMLILLRQGKISKWFSGIGQEAIAVGVTMALDNDDYILPLHRNLGVFTSRNIPLHQLFAQWQGKAEGFTKGRDRSFHFGTQKHRIIGMISHLGPQLGVADGIALAHKIKGEDNVTAVFTGEGGTSEGDFHEALNLAAVWDLPVLFCVENNGYGLSTPVSEQFRCKSIADKGIGYGIESMTVEGNNILEVFNTVKHYANSIRQNPRPVLLEFNTFRIRGHEEASGTDYVPETLISEWKRKDPLENYIRFLKDEAILSEELETQMNESLKNEIESELNKAFGFASVESDVATELNDVYAPFEFSEIKPEGDLYETRFIDAISSAIKQSMERFPELVIMGQDIAEYGGAFKVTKDLVREFGKKRIRNTPICESAVVSAAMGLSINGLKAMVEMQFADFVSSGFNPIVNYLAKTHYRWGEKADVVIRMPCGAGVGAGPFHSQTNEAWFVKTPGLKVVYPAFPYDAKGLLNASVADPNPVLFFEHKALYRSITQEIPENYYTLPIGKAAVLQSGTDLTIIAFGAPVHWVLEVVTKFPENSIGIIDLRTLQPLDTETIFMEVKKSGKVLIVQEDSLFGGLGSEISAQIVENCFHYLDAPVKRAGSLDTPIPFSRKLEDQYLPKVRLESEITELLGY